MEPTHLLTLIAANDAAAAEISILAPVVESLRALGGWVGETRQFDDGAWDVPLAGIAAEAATSAADYECDPVGASRLNPAVCAEEVKAWTACLARGGPQ